MTVPPANKVAQQLKRARLQHAIPGYLMFVAPDVYEDQTEVDWELEVQEFDADQDVQMQEDQDNA